MGNAYPVSDVFHQSFQCTKISVVFHQRHECHFHLPLLPAQQRPFQRSLSPRLPIWKAVALGSCSFRSGCLMKSQSSRKRPGVDLGRANAIRAHHCGHTLRALTVAKRPFFG